MSDEDKKDWSRGQEEVKQGLIELRSARSHLIKGKNLGLPEGYRAEVVDLEIEIQKWVGRLEKLTAAEEG